MSGQGTFCKSKYSTQIYSTIIINILSFSHGIAFGWISPVIRLLQSSDTPLNQPITTNEVSWIGGYWSIGCISGSIIFGLLIDKIGRKRTITLIALPHIGLWITSIFATETHHFYVSRFLGGLAGGGITVTFPIFVAEISSNNIRGRLGSVYMVSMNFGIMVGYILSSYFNYNTVGVLVVGFPALSCILSYIVLSETPQFLLKDNREENALKSIKFYRNHKSLRDLEDYKSVYDEFEIIRFSVMEQRRSGSITLADFTTKQSLKALFVGAGLMALNQLSGGYAFLNYAATFFEKSYSDIDANLSTIIVGISQIVGTLSSLILVDFLGRKMLLIISFSGMSAGMFCCGIYQYFYPIYDLSRFTWIPTVTFSGVIFFGSIGVFSAVFVVFVELLSTKIRAVGSIICVSVLSSLGFLMLRIVPKLLDSLDLQGVLYLFSGCSLGGMIFVLTFVQETKGKVLDAVEDVHEKESKITLFNK